MLLARQQVLQNRTVSVIDAYTSSDIFLLLDDTSFGNSCIQLPLIYILLSCCNKGPNRFCHSFAVSPFPRVFCFKVNPYILSPNFARITTRKAPIARPSICTYHESLNLNNTMLTAIVKIRFQGCSLTFRRRLLAVELL